MFDPTDKPRLFALPPGVDFPRALVAGLRHRMAALPPEAIARVDLFVNTRRMQRRLRAVLADGGAALLPRVRLITDLGQDAVMAGLPPAIPPLRRRLELTQLIGRLLDSDPDLAPRTAIYDLADSLATLMDEMQGEGVTPDAIARLDLSDHAVHWQRSLSFIRIVSGYFAPDQPPDAEARQRLVVERLTAAWAVAPPQHPVIVAGSTGSRGATALLMRAVADLPQGAVVLPGFDFDQPDAAWQALADAMTAEDHPQYRFRSLLDRLKAGPADVRTWHDTPPPSAARNRLVSLSLRPAPVTDQWLHEGPALGDLRAATDGLILIEAASPRQEALAIALCLRQVAEGTSFAALVTPDRTLARQVTAALDRWGIVPDDSAGRPLALSAPGRFLRHVSALIGRKLTAEGLLTLLKHPLTATGADRGLHLLTTRELELRLRKKGPQFPHGADLIAWAGPDPARLTWANWLAAAITRLDQPGPGALVDHVTRHLALAEVLAAGPGGTGTGRLWQGAAGAEAKAATEELSREATHGGTLTAADYADLFTAILNRRDVRETVQAHPRIMIWGTLEARVQGADLVILGGLNDGIWPARPAPDPWLNRQMRQNVGLLLPERQIGLSAHDYQQAIAAPQVILTRAARDAEAETVPSRWLNRLINLMTGLPDQTGPEALAAMRARGAVRLQMAAGLDVASALAPEKRPAPRPPIPARPRGLFVTEITRLIRDPYAIYAKHILRLRPLDPLLQPPDARERGLALHSILEQFIQRRPTETPDQARDRLMATADAVLLADIPWPAARRLWRARLDRLADWFLAEQAARPGHPVAMEKTGSVTLENPDFTLSARPDRIDEMKDGRLNILDYKTGAPPTPDAQRHFDKQLLLEAAMAERGAFAGLTGRTVAEIRYIGLTATPKVLATEMTPGLTDAVWQELIRLITRYQERDQGYASRRAVASRRFEGDYDHLARFGEWDDSDSPVPEDVG